MIKANPTSSCTLRIVCAGDPDSILYELHADNVVRVREKLQLSEIVITLLVDQGSLLCFGSVAAVPLTATIRVSADNLATIARDLRGFAGLPPTDERRKFVVIVRDSSQLTSQPLPCPFTLSLAILAQSCFRCLKRATDFRGAGSTCPPVCKH